MHQTNTTAIRWHHRQRQDQDSAHGPELVEWLATCLLEATADTCAPARNFDLGHGIGLGVCLAARGCQGCCFCGPWFCLDIGAFAWFDHDTPGIS